MSDGVTERDRDLRAPQIAAALPMILCAGLRDVDRGILIAIRCKERREEDSEDEKSSSRATGLYHVSGDSTSARARWSTDLDDHCGVSYCEHGMSLNSLRVLLVLLRNAINGMRTTQRTNRALLPELIHGTGLHGSAVVC